MWPSGENAFFDYTVNREGFTPYLYADTLNLVTTGIGNLVDAGPQAPLSAGTFPQRARMNNLVSAGAMAPAMSLPWKLKGPNWNPDPKNLNLDTRGNATATQIATAWAVTKTQNEAVPNFSQRGGGSYKNLTNITLDMQGIQELFIRTLRSFDKTLSERFIGYLSWPVDAQFALMSMAWSMGPAFDIKFPQFKAAVDKRDFTAAIPLSFFQGGGGTQAKPAARNADNQLMFGNAAMVERTGADPSVLIFPVSGGSVVSPTNIIATASTIVKTAEVGGAVIAAGSFAYGFYRWWKGRP